jgi:EpsI family protein
LAHLFRSDVFEDKRVIARRDLLLGSACVLAAGAAYALKPRRYVSLLGQTKLDQIVPSTFGNWTSREVGDLVAPRTESSLSAKLYDETLERVYQHSTTGAQVMMLMAHGDTQSNDLQLHRPEDCYPAFGFALTNNYAILLQLPGGVTIPARHLVADAPGRRETIIYWSRLGESIPIDDGQQRLDRLRTALDGYIADGVLARFSALGSEPTVTLTLLEGFIPELLMAVPVERRRALIGTGRAEAMTAAGF